MILEMEAVASAMNAAGAPPKVKATGWSVDTRTQNAGDVYFALRGPNFDGHAFVGAAREKGAAAVVVERGGQGAGAGDRGAMDTLVVEDPLCALQRLGQWARTQWAG